MAPGGGQTPAPDTTGGEFLLSLLQKPHNLCHLPDNRAPTEPHRSLPIDPAIAAVGPTIPFDDHLPIHWRHSPPYPPNFFPHGFPQNSNPCPSPSASCSGNPYSGNQFPSDGSCHGDQLRNVNHFPGKQLGNGRGVDLIRQEPKFMFGSLSSEIQNREGATNDNAIKHWNFDRNKRGVVSKFDGLKNSDVSERNRSSNGLNLRMQEPPGFPSKMRGGGKWNGVSRIMSSEQNAHMRDANSSELNSKGFLNDKDGRLRRGLVIDNYRSRGKAANGLKFSSQIEDVRADNDCGGDEDKSKVWGQDTMSGGEQDGWQDHLTERLVKSLVLKNVLKREKHYISRDMDVRSDTRGKWLLSQRMRNFKSLVACRSDIERLNTHFLAIYESLVPEVEEKAKQKQLLTLLETLVSKEWPNARLYLYGSCANTFGVSKSDIDVCLAIEGADIDKSEILLKLADILQAENLQNVQALTRARVPIVKLMDPATGISCDICINNVLAVVNTKLLLDYAQIDVRLHQLAFIVKHWAKSRRVNETYQGTLSSYAYVLMCIHFLQQRKPAILPCLQAMEATYSTTIDTVECAYFDQVQNLRDFGSHNKESIAQLVWGFFCYWAYRHDYANAVISVRTGSIISKQSKDWTRRIGNDRHLICIEDPFEVSHDLGRVVDKYSIKVLREEFERAADIMQNDPNPCVALFEPYAHL